MLMTMELVVLVAHAELVNLMKGVEDANTLLGFVRE